MKIFDTLMEIVYPKRCLFCNCVIATTSPLCIRCVKKVNGFRYYGNINIGVVKYVISPFYYKGGIKNAITQFKFQHQKQYGINICDYLIEAIKKDNCEFDVVVAVPMYWFNRLERGFNQSEILAKRIAYVLAKRFIKGCIVKTRATYEQHTLDAQERVDNLETVYKMKNADKIIGNRILLVDDVCTTGMTLRQVATMLLEYGAISVIGAVIARGNVIKMDNS